jgi:nucleoside-diphosphate-sugar epimerase
MGVVKEALGEAVNLASETETRVIDLANWIVELTGNETKIVFKARRDWDQVVKRRASIEKATRILGYAPKTDIRTGLKETYEWILENRGKIERAFLSPRAELEVEMSSCV